MLPFILVLWGVISDYITSTIGLNFYADLYETQLHYNPIYALFVFWTAIIILTLTLPRKKPWTLGISGFALLAYIGAINNTFLILKLFL